MGAWENLHSNSARIAYVHLPINAANNPRAQQISSTRDTLYHMILKDRYLRLELRPCAVMSQAIIFLTQGTEEMEFTITYDVLVRGGVNVTSVYVPETGKSFEPVDGLVIASRGVKLAADMTLEAFLQNGNVDKYDAYIIPGGAGAANTLSKDENVLKILRDAHANGKVVGMICAGTLAALGARIGLKGPITSHPSVKDQLASFYDYKESAVVVSNNFVTSRGPGTTFLFALTLVEKLVGVEKRKEISGPMMLTQEHL